MKPSKISTVLLAAIALATAQHASAGSLSSVEINNVREVLRALNINEAQLSNEMIENLRNRGQQIRFYEKSKLQYIQKSQNGEIYMTCGAGSHGGDKDPV
ncbi:MAG: hypothetical protein AAGB31_10840 [Bdellovibrio sp.]